MKLAALALGSLLSIQALASQALASHPHHYVVFEVDERGVLTPRFQTVVDLAADRTSLTDEEIRTLSATTSRDVEVLTVRAEDDAGREVFRDAVEVGRSIYTEFASTGEVQPYRADGKRAFVVRIPVGKATRLSIGSSDLSRATLDSETSFPLDSLQRQVKPLASVPVPLAVSAPLAGSPANRVDVLVMGDGYTAAQQTKFNTDAANLLATFLSISPYSEYQGFVNSQTAFFASTQSGADHPPYNASCPNPPACCSDTDALSDPFSGTFVNTAFDGTFCTSTSTDS